MARIKLNRSGYPQGVDIVDVNTDPMNGFSQNPLTGSFDITVDTNIGSSNGISQPKSLEELILKIKNTTVYKTAYSVFSQAPNSSYWLAQLQSIIDGITLPDDTFLDRWNWSQQYDDKVAKIYNEAISAISQLLAKYQEHVNSLPITAVQQDSLAGINSAITGNIHGSTLSGEGLSPNSGYDLPSTSSLEGISSIAGFALNSVSGLCGIMSSFADVALKFKELDLNRSKFSFDKVKSFTDFKKILSDSGTILSSSSWDELDELDPDWSNNATARAKALYNSYNEIIGGKKYGPIVVSGINDGYGDHQLSYSDDGSGYMVGGTSYGVFLERDYADLGRMQTDLIMAEMQRRAEVGFVNITEGLTPEEVDQATSREQKANSRYNARKALIFLDRLDKLVERSSNHDPIASVELINLMNNADWQESAVYMFGELTPEVMKDIGTTLYDISSWNSDQFNKVKDFFKSKL